jgi:hypothetical protein
VSDYIKEWRGHAEAPDEQTAIKKAIEQFEIGPALQNRLLARRR